VKHNFFLKKQKTKKKQPVYICVTQSVKSLGSVRFVYKINTIKQG